MAKYVSSGNTQEDIQHYQKRLIPINIVVCIMCLVSIFTLMFAPILRIDIAKIVSSPEISAYVRDMVSESFNGDDNNGDDNGNNSDSDEGLSDKMISTVASSVIDPLLQSIGESDISLNFTAFSSLKVLTGGSEALKDELSGMVAKFADGLIDAINNLFKDGAIVDKIITITLPTLINTSIDALKNNPETPAEIVDLLNDLTKADIDKLCDDLKGLQTTKTPEQFVDKLVEIAPNLMLTLTGQNLEDDDIQTLREELTKVVDESVEKVREQDSTKTFDYNLEAFICIQLSQSMDIAELDKLIEEMLGNENESSVTPYLAFAADSKADGDNKDGDETTEENDYTIYTSFSDILNAMENTQTNLNESIRVAINNALDQLGEDIDIFATGFGMLFVFISVFMALWFILFLFSLLHIFAKNKRFVMWYVKLLCWIPGIIWLALTLASIPAIVAPIATMMELDVPVSVVTAVIGGLSSWGTGVSYICYWLLWIVSIFWAFPIKRKIRKLKKQAKQEQY